MSGLENHHNPSLFLSARFIEQADELGFAHVRINPADVNKVIRLGRHGTIENLGGLMVHASGERKGYGKTVYHAVHSLESPALPQLDHDVVNRKEILEVAKEHKVQVLALRGTTPSEPNLSLELYRAARKWQESGSQAGGVPDTWFSIIIGGGLGFGFYIIADGLERAPSSPTNYAYAFGIGAVIGGLARPLLQRAREHYDRPTVKTLRPILLD